MGRQGKAKVARMTDIITALNAITPLGLAAGLAIIIYLQIKNRGRVNHIATNHLHNLHELPQVAADIRAMRELLQTVNDNVVYLKARVNGK